jgi:hypothetical protein
VSGPVRLTGLLGHSRRLAHWAKSAKGDPAHDRMAFVPARYGSPLKSLGYVISHLHSDSVNLDALALPSATVPNRETGFF